MRTLLLVLGVACPFAAAVGQSVDYNKIILPDGASDVSFEERLVQLAWKNNPATRIVDAGVDQAKEETKVTRTAWSTLVGVTGNINEFNINRFAHPETTGNQFYPRYNFFVQLPLGLLVQNPHIKGVGKAKITAAEEQVKLLKLELRSRVLKLYSEYKMAETVKRIRSQSVSDDESNYLLVEQRFKNGEVMVDEYLKAQRARNDLQIQFAIAENDYKQAKLGVEEVIGMRLEDVK